MKVFFISICILFSFVSGAQLSIETEGNLDFEGSVNNVNEAGLDYSFDGVYNTKTIYLSVIELDELNKKGNPNNKWRVFVYLNETANSELTIEIERTGNGYKPNANGTPNIHDGTNFFPVEQTQSYFIRGKGDIVYIPVSVRINGASVLLGASEFESNLVFTVYEDW